MKKTMLCLVFILIFCNLYSEEIDIPPKISLMFYNIGWNFLDSITYNYGLNFIGAGLETWAFIETGLDWKWRNISYNNAWSSNCGRPGLYIGYIVPALTPILTYTIGRFTNNYRLQITALALVQSLMLTLAIQTPLKMITGRSLPEIVTELDHTRNQRTDNFSDEFNWFNSNFIGGWPSGHTATAFSAAATIAEIYGDSIWLKIGVYTYATLIAFGVTLDVHWVSEAIAGALIGYAIGKTVGKSFNKVLEKDNNRYSFYFTQNSIGVMIRF